MKSHNEPLNLASGGLKMIRYKFFPAMVLSFLFFSGAFGKNLSLNSEELAPLAITTPAPRTVWHTGQTMTIRWNISVNEVFISLCKNNNPYITIFRGNGNSKSYTWTIPDTIDYDTSYLVVVSTDYNYNSSVQAGNLTIICPNQFTLDKGTRDTSLIIGTMYHHGYKESLQFSWNVRGKIPRIYDIFYKNIDSAKWDTLKSGNTYSGYNWSIPNTLNGKYQVKIKTQGDTFSLTSGIISLTPTPVRVELPYAISDVRPTFKWSRVAGISKYLLYVRKDYKDTIVGDTVADTVYTPSFDLIEGSYDWYVFSFIENWTAPWMKIGSEFKIEFKPPQLIDPIQNITRERRPTFMWYALAKNTRYTITLSPDSQFSGPVSFTTSDTSFRPETDLTCGPIYWKVADSLRGKISKAKNLIIVPDTIPLLKAIKEEILVSEKPVLTWESVKGAKKYKVEVVKKTGGLGKRTSGGNPVSTVLCSAIVSDTFYVLSTGLELGNYECKVSSDRDDYATPSYPEKFKIVESLIPTAIVYQGKAANHANHIQIVSQKRSSFSIFLPECDRTQVSMFGIDGRSISSKSFIATAGLNSVELAGLRLKSGFYIMQIKTGKEAFLQKITIK
jgi:hypothetical protein